MALVDFVSDLEIVFGVDLGVFSDVANAREDMKIFAEIFLDSFGLGRRLDDHEIFRHIYYNSIDYFFRKGQSSLVQKVVSFSFKEWTMVEDLKSCGENR